MRKALIRKLLIILVISSVSGVLVREGLLRKRAEEAYSVLNQVDLNEAVNSMWLIQRETKDYVIKRARRNVWDGDYKR